jgi:uncharacterized phage protein (TIGR02218 family)
MCWCWRLTRRDGVRLGFTDHDRDLTFDGTTFAASTGFTATQMKESVGLNVDNLNAVGALTSATLNEDELAAGVFDDAGVELFRVNWQQPDQRVLMRRGSLGEIRRTGTAFNAEVRGLAHYLQQPKGRLFQYGCDADLGDGRCGVVLNAPAYQGSGIVSSATDARALVASGLDGFADDWFTRGLVSWTVGANAGYAMEVRRHSISGTDAAVELWQPMAFPIQVGDAFTITAGCDKRFATCIEKFANADNFRGFPHMPGNDFITGYPTRGDPKNSGDGLWN